MYKYPDANLMRKPDKKLLQFSDDKKGATCFAEYILLMEKGR